MIGNGRWISLQAWATEAVEAIAHVWDRWLARDILKQTDSFEANFSCNKKQGIGELQTLIKSYTHYGSI